MKNTLLTIVGTRPQFIKASVLSRKLKTNNFIEEVLVHTGQHYDSSMSEVFFRDLQIPTPKYNLGIHEKNHGKMVGKMLIAIEEVLQHESPNAVLVYGDTNSTLAGALAASKLNIPLIHVEAGERSFNRMMPEEINRVLTDQLSTLLFCSSRRAMKNLCREGIKKNVFHVGDLLYDACLQAKQLIDSKTNVSTSFANIKKPWGVLTIHRQHNASSSSHLKSLLTYVNRYALDHDIQIIFPVHPRINTRLNELNLIFPNIQYTKPANYLEMQMLLMNALVVFTDSGGLQKEAYFHQTPCITLRSETEWTETIQAGWNRLWIHNSWNSPRRVITEYGTGNSAGNIIHAIESFFAKDVHFENSTISC